MAAQQEIPTFKLVLVGDGGTGKVMSSQETRVFKNNVAQKFANIGLRDRLHL